MKKMEKTLLLLCLASIIVFTGTIANAASPADVPRMTIDELKKLLDDAETDLVVLDVRTGSSWKNSDAMIESAVREAPGDVASWIEKYTPEQIIVLYCT